MILLYTLLNFIITSTFSKSCTKESMYKGIKTLKTKTHQCYTTLHENHEIKTNFRDQNN